MPPNSPPFRLFVLIPVYNHAGSLRDVVTRTLAAHPEVIVVDDGSTDGDVGKLLAGLPITLLSHETNRGKGAAILTAAKEARARGASHLLTLDADGQHDPREIPVLLAAARLEPQAVIVGARDLSAPTIPRSASFGRSFSNFWFRVQTGHKAEDMQSGFRLYPLDVLDHLSLAETRYSFEVEVLVKAAWAGVPIRSVPVSVFYPPGEERVTHFHRFLDNARLSRLNTKLTMRALLPFPHKQFRPAEGAKISLLHPVRALKRLLAQHAKPTDLAVSSALGMFLGTLPLIGFHSLAILLTANFFRRNKVVALAVSQLCAPPFVPALCIEAGYYLRHGEFLTEVSFRTLGTQFLSRVWEYLLGSFLLAPLLALLTGCGVYLTALAVARLSETQATASTGLPETKEPPAAWSSRSFGSRLQHGVFYAAIRLGGRWAAYALLHPVVLYYTLFRPAIRGRATPYLRRRFPRDGFFAQLRHSYKMSLAFGKVLVDQAIVGILGPQAVTLDFRARAGFLELLAEKRGLILLMSHVGGWQVALPALSGLGVTVHLVLQQEAGNVDRMYYEHGDGSCPFRIIDPLGEMGGTLSMLEALQRKEVLCMMGDRVLGAGKNTLARPFLGGEAPFPFSAFRLASATGAPLAVVFSHKAGLSAYEVLLDRVIRVEENLGRRPEGYAPALDAFLASLEGFVQRHPYEFFNFYDMWQNP